MVKIKSLFLTIGSGLNFNSNTQHFTSEPKYVPISATMCTNPHESALGKCIREKKSYPIVFALYFVVMSSGNIFGIYVIEIKVCYLCFQFSGRWWGFAIHNSISCTGLYTILKKKKKPAYQSLLSLHFIKSNNLIQKALCPKVSYCKSFT